MIKKIFILFISLTAFIACSDEALVEGGGSNVAAGEVTIYLEQPDPSLVINARADENDPEKRLDEVILFAFNTEGALLNQSIVSQEVSAYSGTIGNYTVHGKVRFYLPEATASLYAVANYPVGDLEEVKSLTDLQTRCDTITHISQAFKGRYVMSGMTDQLTDKAAIVIPLKRMAAKHIFRIKNELPVNESFDLTQVSILNLPNRSYLLATPDKEPTADQAFEEATHTGDAVYSDNADVMAACYLDSTLIETTEADGMRTFEFSMFENRRGKLNKAHDDNWPSIAGFRDEVQNLIRPSLKRGVALEKEELKYATYVCIEGVYQYKAENRAMHAYYFVYLGSDNDTDYNVKRNYKYTTTVTIKACDKFDTRVEADPLGDVELYAPDNILDAHFNVREALLYSPAGWEVYVENPDETPWLELSTSPNYVPRTAATASQPDVASFRLSGTAGTQYLYIHTDEYVPEVTEMEMTQLIDQGAQFQNRGWRPREGTICYRRTDEPDKVQKYVVRQYPAQLLWIKAWDVNQAQWVYKAFFMERIQEKPYLPWGFTGHWSMTLDNLITTGLYDGLSTTRKEYMQALWGDDDSETHIDPPAKFQDVMPGKQPACYYSVDDQNNNKDRIMPSSIASGYAIAKNRDRNGNKRIDYDEILWYLPTVHQMEQVLSSAAPTHSDNATVWGEEDPNPGEFQNNYRPLELGEENYWTSTPSVSDKYGITPGRAYYVYWHQKKNEAKRGIGLRSQSFHVICCRDWQGWKGDNESDADGGVTTNPGWDDEDINMPKEE